MIPDPYSVLGVSHGCSEDELKTAYRKLAKQYHPDLHPGDEAAAKRMNEINAAYEQIKNPPKTAQGFPGGGFYGQQGTNQQSGPYTYYYTSGGAGFDPFSDFFRGYTQQQQTSTPRRGFRPFRTVLIVMLILMALRLVSFLLLGGLYSNANYYSYGYPYYYYYSYGQPQAEEHETSAFADMDFEGSYSEMC